MKRKRHYAMGGSGLDPITLLSSYGTELLGDYTSAATYRPQLGPEKTMQDYGRDNTLAAITKGPIGVIPSLLRMLKDKNTTVFGSPGTYQQGGPMNSPTRPRTVRVVKQVPNPDTLFLTKPDSQTTNTRIPYPQAVADAHSSKSKSKSRIREMAYGGDVDSVLSSNSFQVQGNPSITDGNYYPEFNAYLDNNEVVDTSAKFVFSDDLMSPNVNKSFAKRAKPLYKAKGDLEGRGDSISMATVEQLNNQITSLATEQELFATALGFRDSISSGLANGGPLPWEDFNVKEFQTWYNAIPGNKKLVEDGIWGPKTEKAYKTSSLNYLADLYPKVPDPTKPADLDLSNLPIRRSNTRTAPNINSVLVPTNITTKDSSIDLGNSTIGDIFQGVEVASKFFNLFEPPKVDPQLTNQSPITRTSYDPNQALYQNQRNFSNVRNSINTASPNIRRAVINNLYATKLNADNQVLTNYQNMNNEALVNYENRLAQRRAGNIASQFRTNDLNAANVAAFDSAQQNAFTSLGNFGEALNRRKRSDQALQLLQLMYPQVYSSVINQTQK